MCVYCIERYKQPNNTRQLPSTVYDGLTITVQGYILPNANSLVFSITYMFYAIIGCDESNVAYTSDCILFLYILAQSYKESQLISIMPYRQGPPRPHMGSIFL